VINELTRVVKEVGIIMLEWRSSELFEGVWDGPQYKAKVDLMAHEALVDRLYKLAPEIPVISEEDASSIVDKRPECYWLIDPIDGTASFATGYPGFVTQVALIENYRPRLAAIYAPVLNELYTAVSGKGAYLNGNTLRVTGTNMFETLIDNYPEPRGVTAELYRSLDFKAYIECGSISLKICKIADGVADVFFKSVTIRDWDIAAPHLVLEESGGFLTDAYGNRPEYRGSYEHAGIIATQSKEANEEIVVWHKAFTKGD
jgi:3'(2'), 5'-bisphosphate nucleotidase/myo-inositol-1(or 4)-monophosphatase